jgi:hypothetical protein
MKAHRTDRVSLTFGMIFLVVAGWWLVAQTLDLTLPAVGWFVAGGLILFGLLGLLGALRSARSDPAAQAAGSPASSSPATGAPATGSPLAGSPVAMAPGSPVAVSPAAPVAVSPAAPVWPGAAPDDGPVATHRGAPGTGPGEPVDRTAELTTEPTAELRTDPTAELSADESPTDPGARGPKGTARGESGQG